MTPRERMLRTLRGERADRVPIVMPRFELRSREDAESIEEPFRRLIEEQKLIGHRHDGFWCMDTFKEHQILTDMHRQGNTPWELWKQPG